MTPACTALSLVAVFGTAYAIVRAVLRRRADRAWAAGVAGRVSKRDAEVEMLNQLYAMDSAGERP